MSKIVFFCIPAHGHTNPTIEVVRELTLRGHEVWYYSFEEFREKIESAGAKYISCDPFLPPTPIDIDKKVGKDFAALIEMVADTTISLDKTVCSALKEFSPDCIVSDSICFWGKLFSIKLRIPFICSTTTFAFNQYTAKMMKPGLKEMLRMFTGMPRINAKMRMLKEHGYDVDDFLKIIQNDNDTNTIVYTSKEFQPMSETFSDKYTFVGPSISDVEVDVAPKQKPIIYISLGTVLNKNSLFYKNCIEALKDCNFNVIMSVGDKTDISSLGIIPNNFNIKTRVSQIQVLKNADVFITHCGMNSVNESIYCGVPMVLFPQHSEQGLVAARAEELGAGIKLNGNKTKLIKEAVYEVLNNKLYKQNAEKLANTFKKAGGASKAADAIENVIISSSNF